MEPYKAYIQNIVVEKRESETGRKRERERERERERYIYRDRDRDFHLNLSKMEQRVLLICHYFVRIVKINYIFV